MDDAAARLLREAGEAQQRYSDGVSWLKEGRREAFLQAWRAGATQARIAREAGLSQAAVATIVRGDR